MANLILECWNLTMLEEKSALPYQPPISTMVRNNASLWAIQEEISNVKSGVVIATAGGTTKSMGDLGVSTPFLALNRSQESQNPNATSRTDRTPKPVSRKPSATTEERQR